MRVRHTMIPTIWDDTAMQDVLFAPNETISAVISDRMQRFTAGRFEINTSANENLALGDVQDVRFVYIQADGDFNVNINGTGALLIQRQNTTVGAFAKLEGDFHATSLNVANPSASVILRGRYCVWGDPTP